MDYKFVLLTFLALALAVEALPADKNKDDEMMEDSTKSPIADLAVIDTEVKATTERPPTASNSSPKNATMIEKSEEQQNAQPHTVADFIIHPLIAFKPRNPEENVAGKQAGDSSSTTPSPWSIFGFNAGQGLGSSVSSLAGSVSGWLNDRIQLPGLVESPIRDPSSTSSTTTTTTQRPDVVVRVQHRPTTRRPLIAINNRNRPASFHNNNNLYSDEYDDEYDEDDEFTNNINNKRRGNNKNKNQKRRPNQQQQLEEEDSFEEEDNIPIRRPQQNQAPQKRRRRPIVEDDFSEEEEEDDDDDAQSAEQSDNVNESESDENNDDEEDDTPQGPNRRRVTAQNNNKRRRQQQQLQRRKSGNGVRRIQKHTDSDEAEDDDEDDEEVQFYYGSLPSTKRSQNEANFFQRGQENIINQIRQLTRGRTPAQVGTLVRKTTNTKQTSSMPSKRRQQATILVNRNGQTIYLAPELLSADLPLVNTQVHTAEKFPQPPLSVPLKRKNGPTQYITIPWSQLGISPPDQLHSVTEGVQTQPLILNIPASAIQAMQNQSTKRKKQPVITAEAVPLLAEASIADVFKPATFPNDRHTADVAHKPNTAAAATGMPLIITSKKKSGHKASTAILPHRIRSGTIVEKAPASAERQQEVSDEKSEKEYLLVGEDSDPGLGRQVQPVYGDARYIWKRGQFAARRNGRELDASHNGEQQPDVKPLQQPNGEQLIPVQIISELAMVEQPKSDEVKPVLMETPQEVLHTADSELMQKEVQQKDVNDSDVLANKSEEPVAAA